MDRPDPEYPTKENVQREVALLPGSDRKHIPAIRSTDRTWEKWKKVEFGTKIGLAQIYGFVKTETLSWDAYNESADLIPHAESYKKLKGCYPELIQVDKIYGTNKKRKWCAERNIRMTVVSKKKKVEQTAYQRKKYRDEFKRRNQIEGKFGQAKRGYGLNNVKAKLSDTSHSWIATIFLSPILLNSQS